MRDPGDAPQRAVQTLALTTLQQIGLTMVRFGLPVLVPFVRDDLRLSLVQAGILLVALDVGGLAAFIPTGIVADRWGERRVLVAGGVLMGAAAALAALAPTYGLLLAGLTLAGLGFPSGHTAGSKMVLRQFPARSRGLAIGICQAGLPGGAIAALLIPALASLGGWRLSLAAVGAACAAFGLSCLALPRGEGLPGGAGTAAIRALAFDRDFWPISLMVSTLVIGQFTLQGYLPLFLPLFLVDEHGWAPSAAGRLLVFVHAGGSGACSGVWYRTGWPVVGANRS
ncbi:MAG: MFS transporter [Armatimonadota bacterium]|nr:MFS transporter [Armatimonadota bacterium]MDR7518030.1 MFS transporter [Armatimonadota bacterium]